MCGESWWAGAVCVARGSGRGLCVWRELVVWSHTCCRLSSAYHPSRFAVPQRCFCKHVRAWRVPAQVIFTDPYYKAEYNKHTSPQLDAAALALHTDAEAKAAITSLKVGG